MSALLSTQYNFELTYNLQKNVNRKKLFIVKENKYSMGVTRTLDFST